MATPRNAQDVKTAIAAGVQQMLLAQVPMDRSAPIPELEGPGTSVEAQEVGPLLTQIRVKTANKGLRYLTVQVAERF